jgi:hypothetical protein
VFSVRRKDTLNLPENIPVFQINVILATYLANHNFLHFSTLISTYLINLTLTRFVIFILPTYPAHHVSSFVISTLATCPALRNIPHSTKLTSTDLYKSQLLVT